MIDGKTRLVGLIGNPVEHSFSPLIHNAAFKTMGTNWCYVPLRIESKSLDKAIDGLIAAGFFGINITAPHKQTSLKFVDELNKEASSVGAVNTLVFKTPDGNPCHVKGFNTDVHGFKQSLKFAHFNFETKQKAIVVGAGGAAKAVIAGLAEENINEIILLNRNIERGEKTCEQMKESLSLSDKISFEALNNPTLIKQVQDASLLINATTVGTYPNNTESIWPENEALPKDLFVFDLVYNPAETTLLQQAKKSGARGINGLEMLVQQAAKSIEHWTNIKPPIDEMRNATKQIMEDMYA